MPRKMTETPGRWPTPSLVHDLAGRCPWLLGLLPRCRCQSRTRPRISEQTRRRSASLPMPNPWTH